MPGPFSRLDTMDPARCDGVCAVRIEITEDEAAWLAGLRRVMRTYNMTSVRMMVAPAMATFLNEEEDAEGSDEADMAVHLVLDEDAFHFEGEHLVPALPGDEGPLKTADIPIAELAAHFKEVDFTVAPGLDSAMTPAQNGSNPSPASPGEKPRRSTAPGRR